LQRVKEFSKNLKHYNDKVLLAEPKLPSATEQHEIEKSKQKLTSARERALEFSRKVVVPTKPTRSSDASRTTSGQARQTVDDLDIADDDSLDMNMHVTVNTTSNGNLKRVDSFGLNNKQANKLAELEALHEDRKRQVEAIKKSMGMR